MKITKGKEHVIIQDDFGHTLLLAEDQISELVSELSNDASIFNGKESQSGNNTLKLTEET